MLAMGASRSSRTKAPLRSLKRAIASSTFFMGGGRHLVPLDEVDHRQRLEIIGRQLPPITLLPSVQLTGDGGGYYGVDVLGYRGEVTVGQVDPGLLDMVPEVSQQLGRVFHGSPNRRLVAGCDATAKANPQRWQVGIAGGYETPAGGGRQRRDIPGPSRRQDVEHPGAIAPRGRSNTIYGQAAPSGARLRPRLGFNPTRPQADTGMRIEPPPSLAVPTGTRRPATAAADPPLEPPHVRPESQGLWQGPYISGSVAANRPSSSMLDLPTGIKPAAFNRLISGWSLWRAVRPPGSGCRQGRRPGTVLVVLHQQRDAGEGQGVVDLSRSLEGQLETIAHDRVEHRVVQLDAVDSGLYELDRLGLADLTASAWAVASRLKTPSDI